MGNLEKNAGHRGHNQWRTQGGCTGCTCIPPPLCIPPPTRPCASPPSPAWEAGYDQLCRAGQSQTLSDTTIRDYLLHKWQAPARQFSVAYRKKDHHGQNHQLQAVKRHFPPVWLGSLQLFWGWPFLQGVCHVWALWFGWRNIPFNRYSKLYGAAEKLTTHGSQHFHKQNALKGVEILSTAESPQLRVDTHISQNLEKQKEGNRKLVKILLTQVLVCARYW